METPFTEMWVLSMSIVNVIKNYSCSRTRLKHVCLDCCRTPSAENDSSKEIFVSNCSTICSNYETILSKSHSCYRHRVVEFKKQFDSRAIAVIGIRTTSRCDL